MTYCIIVYLCLCVFHTLSVLLLLVGLIELSFCIPGCACCILFLDSFLFSKQTVLDLKNLYCIVPVETVSCCVGGCPMPFVLMLDTIIPIPLSSSYSPPFPTACVACCATMCGDFPTYLCQLHWEEWPAPLFSLHLSHLQCGLFFWEFPNFRTDTDLHTPGSVPFPFPPNLPILLPVLVLVFSTCLTSTFILTEDMYLYYTREEGG